MRISFILLFFSFLFIQCSNKNKVYVEKETKHSDKKIKYKVTPYIIEKPTIDSINYNHYSVYNSPSEGSFILLLNKISRSFEIYNLSKKTLIFKKPFENFVGSTEDYGNVSSIHFQNFDSIFISQQYLISLIDTSKIIFSKTINNPESNAIPKYFYLNQGEFPIYYDNQQNGLLIQTYCSRCKFYDKNYFKSPVESIIRFDSEEILSFPTQYSKRYLEGYYGFSNQVFRTVYNEFSFYSFPIDPNIYVYNRKSNNLKIVGGRTSYQKTEPISLELEHKNNSNIKMRHAYQIPFYHQVIYDPYRKYYYRFFSKSLSLKNEDGTYNSWGDKELILMVFNSNLELLKEINLGKHKYSTKKSFVTKEGLFISYAHYKNKQYDKSSIKFDLFQFSEN